MQRRPEQRGRDATMPGMTATDALALLDRSCSDEIRHIGGAMGRSGLLSILQGERFEPVP